MSPADQLDLMLKLGGNRFLESFTYIMKQQSEGGRTPGIQPLQKQTAQQFFESTPPEYWTTLAQADPAEAQSQLQQFKAVS